jgi:hypothetical protein
MPKFAEICDTHVPPTMIERMNRPHSDFRALKDAVAAKILTRGGKIMGLPH